MARIIAGLSGGVDSAVAAGLLKAAGHEVIGVTLRTWQAGTSRCCRIDDAQKTTAALGIPYHVMNCSSDFQEFVEAPFLTDRLRGLTPNPCVVCNFAVKWKWLLRAAAHFQADAVATGHYAEVTVTESGHHTVKAGKDPKKDQSYMLCRLTQEQLRRTILPLGRLTKSEVRALAARLELPVAETPDSQELCFVNEEDPGDYIEDHTEHPPGPGSFVDQEGKPLGTHRGIYRYTIGQRRGLGIPAGERLYVSSISPECNEITLGDAASLLRYALVCRDVQWMGIAPPEPGTPLPALVKIRSHHEAVRALVFRSEQDLVRIRFGTPVRAPAPGQFAVFYDDAGRILGSGVITGSFP